MGKIIATTNVKGGVGKSAMSLHLAVALRLRGDSVLLVDCDMQGTIEGTMERREQRKMEPDFEVRKLLGPSIASKGALAHYAKFDWVIIDTPSGAASNESLDNATRVADVALIPTTSSSDDTDTLSYLVPKLAEIIVSDNPELKFLGVIWNQDTTSSQREIAAVRKFFQEFDIPTAKNIVRHRSIFRHAKRQGGTVFDEVDDNNKNRAAFEKSRAEVTALVDEIVNYVSDAN